MDYFKNLFANTWTKIATGVAVLVGILLYFLSLKNKKIVALEAQISLVDTQKKADALEAQIKEQKDQEGLLQKEVQEYDRLLQQLEEKRKQLPNDQADKTPQEIVDYWNKN